MVFTKNIRSKKSKNQSEEEKIFKSTNNKTRFLWFGSLIVSLGFSYWLCRFVFFNLHGMKSWPTTLASVGLVVIFIAAIASLRSLGLAVVVGYLIGFILAMLFNTDSLDPGGGTLNNAWIIWGAVFSISILLGLTLDVISILKQKTKH